MQTPYFVIHENLIENNIEIFKKALNKYWNNSVLSYSVKTNSLPKLLEIFNNKGMAAEVVSDEEYYLSKKCGFDNNIVFNGPIKTEAAFLEALRSSAYVNIDSKNELEYITQNSINNAKIGIRVNIPTSIFSHEDVGYQEEGFRFGFSDSNNEFSEALEIVTSNIKNLEIGLHVHCNSITRNVDVYRNIAKYIKSLVQKYRLKLDFIDFGGGFFGGVEGKPNATDYIKAIREELDGVIIPEETTLILEPGSAIIGSAVDLVTSVIDVKDTGLSRIITTDGSRIHIDPLWSKSNYSYTIQSQSDEIEKEQIICGYTCMDHDRIMKILDAPKLSIGDNIIYHKIGAYSMTFGGMFIRYYPDVYYKNSSEYRLVRKRITVDDYYKIHSFLEE